MIKPDSKSPSRRRRSGGNMIALIAVLARLLLAQLFVVAGLSKLGAGYAATRTDSNSLDTDLLSRMRR